MSRGLGDVYKRQVKEVADYVTLSNDEDGVAHVIEKFILAKANCG